jgi:aminopeptidase N
LWLSEGFATYFTNLYLKKKYGRDTLVKRLQEDRKEVIRFSKQDPNPVVDSISPFMDLLNANSYQKGGWVLHMLRVQVGDSLFKKIIQTYYNQYKFSNADTWAFEKVAEEVSGKDLKNFFQQWLCTPGIPEVILEWKQHNKTVTIHVVQIGNRLFQFPLEIEFITASGKQLIRKLDIKKKSSDFKIDLITKPVKITLDPNVELLFEGKVKPK